MFSLAFLAALFVAVFTAPSECGIDIHAAIFQSEDKVSSGGYLTNKFTSLLFTPTIHRINQQLKVIADNIEAVSSQDFMQNIIFATSSLVISLTVILFVKKFRSIRKKIKVSHSTIS